MILERDLERAIAEARPARVSPCPFCPNTHPVGRCPRAAGGGPWEELRKARATIQSLRLQLAAGHEAVGQALAYMPERSNPYLDDAITALRAWLRREAK